ncbi:hypothetical protein BDZ91DRAFT_803794 [Kalaharituber pfeilii]|nr:hypothetical protein BDZ91DRAFT_803794 [Kalaharituber pfeilii]
MSSQLSFGSPHIAHNFPGQYSLFNPTSSKIVRISIDPEGDVTVAVPHSVEGSAKQAIAKFLINSHILCVASPVFRAMLSENSSFKEATSLAARTSIEIQLLDDNPNALAVILRAIHLQSDWVPDSLTTEQLYQVAVLCDKYDMRQSLELWLRKWIPQRESEASTYPHKWLFISIAFARKQILSKVSRELILSYATRGSNFNMTVFDPHVPQFYIDEILKKRETAIQSILAHIDSFILGYWTPITTTTSGSEASGQLKCQSAAYKTELCDTFMLGHLLRELKRIGAYPASSTFKESSLNAIKALLLSLKFPDEVIFQKPTECCKTPYFRSDSWSGPAKCQYCYKPKPEPPNHANCSPKTRLIKSVDNVITKIQGIKYREGTGKSPIKELRPPAAGTDLWNSIKYE